MRSLTRPGKYRGSGPRKFVDGNHRQPAYSPHTATLPTAGVVICWTPEWYRKRGAGASTGKYILTSVVLEITAGRDLTRSAGELLQNFSWSWRGVVMRRSQRWYQPRRCSAGCRPARLCAGGWALKRTNMVNWPEPPVTWVGSAALS